ncbi:hypothetical protein FHS27_004055 [Rhodopirellula rubra]|uniref:Uncharacterized protein n=1 Tax=Aporhodopirellula rubra TaxID=980271 RepID=A0A7W5E241_9BACT|nr:hypothetical protein [Aporhodopirellula rubra]MBB3208228.1 hypothetical protein [Aporhodopirellula rubra]
MSSSVCVNTFKKWKNAKLLESLCLMPPRIGQVRRGISPAPTETLLQRTEGVPVLLPVPLFWDAPPWHTWQPIIAQSIFLAMQSRGVLVSALESELGRTLATSDAAPTAADGSSPASDPPDSELGIPRLLPYRNERYGLSDVDFDHAMVVDMHLSPLRDASGRFAYSAARLGRWEATPEDQPLSGGGWIPAMTLPPDVSELKTLSSKVEQLRVLAPHAAVVISVTPEWIDEHLNDLIAAGPDAILIRLGQIRMTGIAFAQFTQRLSHRVESIKKIPIWLVPPKSLAKKPLGVSDSIKTIALGVSAIAIDSWLDGVIEEFNEISHPASYVSDPMQTVTIEVEEILQRRFDPDLENFLGLFSTLVHDRPSDLLGTFDPEIAEILNLPCVGRLST